MPPEISNRADGMPVSPIRGLAPLAEAAEARGVRIHRLNIGQPDIPTPPELMDGYRNFKEEVLAYGHSAGLYEYREALCGYYGQLGAELATDDVLVTTGGSEAVIFTMLAVADHGDEVLIPEPFYTNYKGFAHETGVRLVPVTTTAEEGYHLPPKRVMERMIGPKTRAILISTPGNPTGVVYTRREMAMLRDLAVGHDLFFISDEVYREFLYDGVAFTSILDFPEIADRAVLLDSTSKQFSSCGARIGRIVCKNRRLMDRVLRFGQARLCPPTVGQWAALAGLRTPRAYFKRVAADYRRRRDICHAALSSMPDVVCHRPEGAFYITAKLLEIDTESFAAWLLSDFADRKETVMVAPASGFYATPGLGWDEIRIAYVINCDDLSRAMEILAKGLETYRNAALPGPSDRKVAEA